MGGGGGERYMTRLSPVFSGLCFEPDFLAITPILNPYTKLGTPSSTSKEAKYRGVDCGWRSPLLLFCHDMSCFAVAFVIVSVTIIVSSCRVFVFGPLNSLLIILLCLKVKPRCGLKQQIQPTASLFTLTSKEHM